MRVGLDVTSACRADISGIGRYVRELGAALVQETADAGAETAQYQLFTRASRWRKRQHLPVIAGAENRWMQDRLWPLSSGVDLIHGLDCRVPPWPATVKVATVHDCFSLLFEQFASAKFRRKKQAAYADVAQRCQRIIAVSENTKQDFLRFVDFPAERIDVVYHGVEPNFFQPPVDSLATLQTKFALEPPYLLFLGGTNSRKNLWSTLQGVAAAQLPKAFKVVVVGGAAALTTEQQQLIKSLGLQERVVWLGYINNEQLPLLYAHAAGLLFASYYEGFGLPLLEAMAMGTPTVAANVGALAEVSAGHAALATPDDADSIGAAIVQALAMSDAARLQAQSYAQQWTWSRCAAQTRRCYQQALADSLS